MGTITRRTTPPERASGFDALYASAAADIARYAYLLTASPTRAAHVTQHAFAITYRDLPDAADCPDDVAWVRTIAGDLALSRRFLVISGAQRLVPRRDRTARVVAHSDDDTLREADIALLRALRRVPSHRRRVFVLRHLFGLSPDRVAAETEATTDVTRLRLLHAHEDLAERVPAVTGPSPNCPEAHEHMSTLTRDLAARYTPKLCKAAAIRSNSRTRTAMLVAVVVASIVALAVASAPRLLDPGTSRDSRTAARERAAANRQAPPGPETAPASDGDAATTADAAGTDPEPPAPPAPATPRPQAEPEAEPKPEPEPASNDGLPIRMQTTSSEAEPPAAQGEFAADTEPVTALFAASLVSSSREEIAPVRIDELLAPGSRAALATRCAPAAPRTAFPR